MSIPQLVSMIPDWLAVTAGREVSVGLSSEDALRRASVLRGLLRGGKLDPASVVLDEDLKAVFHALVALVTEIEPRGGEPLAEEINGVYQFLARVEWPEDDFEEKRDLLRWLAEAGWRAMGISFAELERRRVDPNSSCHPDVLFAICAKLRRLLNTSPATVVSEAVAAYEWIRQFSGKGGLFDERDYFIGETAFLAGEASRQLGRRAEASRWLDRAEAGYRHTVNSAPGLANVAYARLSLRFEMAEYEEVVELAPSLRVSYERMAMEREQAKCCLLEAAALKQCGRLDEALKVLESAVKLKSLAQERLLHARMLAEMGDVNQLEGRIDVAIGLFQAASSLLEGSELSSSRAELKMFAGAAYWGSGQFAAAAEALRSAQADFRELNMASRVAYVSVFLADALLKIDRPREAEWEILQVLPTIEEQKMVPEGFAAVALLRKSVKRRKADPNALRELREHLQKQN